MNKQIFEQSGWVKKNNLKIWRRLKELNLNHLLFKYFRTYDRKDIVIKNFVYFLRLNGLNEKMYFDSIFLIKLLLISSHISFITHQRVKKQFPQLLQVIKELEKKLFTEKINTNYEQEIFSPLVANNNPDYYDFHDLYHTIGNIFALPFKNDEKKQNYYNYGYYFIFFLNLTVMKKMLNDNQNVDIYQVKLTVLNNCHNELTILTPLYFNNIILQNNYFLQRYYLK